MTAEGLTPEEFELHLKDLRERLRAYLTAGEGDARGLLRDAEFVLELAEGFPEVVERNEDVQGLVAEVLARRQQEKLFGQGDEGRQAPGCLLGWLLPRRRNR